MIGVQSYAQKAAAAVERNRVALGRSERRLAEHDAARPDSGDPDELFAWKRDRRDLEDRVESDREAFVWAEAKATEAAEAQRTADEDANHAAAAKHASDTKPVRAALTAIEKAIAAITIVHERNAAIAAANAVRGQRPFIVDAETRLRQRPGRTVEAVYEDRTVWKDGHGNQPTIFVTDRETGELRPQEAGYARRVERVCVQPERITPPSTPERLAELLPALRKALAE